MRLLTISVSGGNKTVPINIMTMPANGSLNNPIKPHTKNSTEKIHAAIWVPFFKAEFLLPI